MKQATV